MHFLHIPYIIMSYLLPIKLPMADPLMTGNVETKAASEQAKAPETTATSTSATQAPAAPLAIHESTSLGDTIIKVIVDVIAKITGRPSPTG